MFLCRKFLSVVTSRVSEVTDIFLYGVWPTMKSTHAEISKNTAEEGQCGTWSTPKKSQVSPTCAPES